MQLESDAIASRGMAGLLPQPTDRTLRSQHSLKAKAANQYAHLEGMAVEDPNQGESSSRLSLKSGRERTAGSDQKRIYVKWPQEACFIGPDRRRVKYNDLTQSQWTAGLTAIAAEEPNPAFQRNMLQYLAALHQDVVDFSFNVALGSHAIILSYLEEGRVTWDDLPLIQALRESYSYK